MTPMKILVFGAGAIGTYIGGSLAHSGHKVTFLERPDAIQELRQNGLHLQLPGDQDLVIPPASLAFAGTLPEALQQGPFDIAVFALKSFDTTAVMETIRDSAGKMPPVLCLSNGVDNEPVLASVLGKAKVIPGTVLSSVGRRAVGDVILERMRGVGIADGFPLSNQLADEFNAAGLNAQLSPHPLAMKWSKLLTNLPANASAAILDLTAAEVFAHPGLFRMEMDMLREALAVMKALHLEVTPLPGVPVKLLALGARLPGFISRPLMKKAVGGGRGGKRPSFHIDLHSGRGKSEVEWLNGAVVHHGRENHIPVPVNTVLTETLSSLTRGDIPLDTFRHQPGMLLQRMEQEKRKD